MWPGDVKKTMLKVIVLASLILATTMSEMACPKAVLILLALLAGLDPGGVAVLGLLALAAAIVAGVASSGSFFISF